MSGGSITSSRYDHTHRDVWWQCHQLVRRYDLTHRDVWWQCHQYVGTTIHTEMSGGSVHDLTHIGRYDLTRKVRWQSSVHIILHRMWVRFHDGGMQSVGTRSIFGASGW